MSQFIEAILFAEFDIDKGSVLRQQYPGKVTDDEGLLALPKEEDISSGQVYWGGTFSKIQREILLIKCPSPVKIGEEEDHAAWIGAAC